jgi:hypothetical protein
MRAYIPRNALVTAQYENAKPAFDIRVEEIKAKRVLIEKK